MAVTFVFKCLTCGRREEVKGRKKTPPTCCDTWMVRDYRGENIGTSFKGEGWARKS